MKVVSVKEMINIEKAADAEGHSYAAMMETAGRGLATIIQERFSYLPGKYVIALVGAGNNGGDALVAIDYLLQWGWKAGAILFKERPEEDPLVSRVLKSGGELKDFSGPDQRQDNLGSELADTEILIDGVLGTGIKLPLRAPLNNLLGETKKILSQLDKSPIIIAVDCPSGIDCDSGEVDPSAIPADLTVIMAAVKGGLLRFPAYNFLGEIEVVDIGLPEGLEEWEKISRETVEQDWVKSRLPERPRDAHKGTFGTGLIIAGSEKFPGAAILAGLSAYRIGAGLVTMAVPESIYQGLIKTLPEATWIKLSDQGGGISARALPQIKNALDRPTACLAGPGLGDQESTGKFLRGLFQLENLPPLVLDADGLRHLSRIEHWPEKLPKGSVLTPHPGEMAVMTGMSVEAIQADRIGTAEKYAREWQQVVLLKGAHTIISSPGEKTRILISADPSLARAGSGDVLAGIICGLIAQGVAPYDGAVCGSWIHARAGQVAGIKVGSPAAVLAGDISSLIGEILADIILV